MLSSEPCTNAEGIQVTYSTANMELGADGTVVFLQGSQLATLDYELVWVNRDGQLTSIDPEWIFNPGENNRSLSLHPDGTRVLITKFEDGNYDVWLKELPQGPATRLTFDPLWDVRARWTPDGESLTFQSTRNESGNNAAVYSLAAAGTGDPVKILDHDLPIWEAVYSPDMEWLLGRTGGAVTAPGGRDVWGIQAETDTLAALVVTDYDEKAISFSPDGRFLLYESDETGRNEVYVRPFPNVNDGKWAVSTNGGVMPLWSHGGGEIFYIDAEDRMTLATVETSRAFRVTQRTTLFKVPNDILFRQPEQYPLYDIAPEDDRFIMFRAVEAPKVPDPHVIMILNWFTELEERTRR